MDFINKVKKLKETTVSPEVKSLCENFLNESSNKDVLLEGLRNSSQEESVSGFLRENTSNIWTEFRNQELDASKKAASSLMESWKDNPAKGSNSGTWISKEKEENTSISSLNESLSKIEGDKAANSFLVSESIKNLGVLESIKDLLASPVSEHTRAKIMLENYKNVIVSKGIPEYTVIENFVNDLNQLTWDAKSKEVFESLSEKVNNFSREIYVSKVIDSIKNSGSREFYSDLYESLNNWMVSSNKSNGLLVNQISKYSFNPVVRNLINFLNLNESKRDSGVLSIPETNQAESFVERIYSPIATNENQDFAFSIGGFIFEATENGVQRIDVKNAAKSYGRNFVDLLGIVAKPYVKVNEAGVHFTIGKKAISITESTTDKPNVFAGRNKLSFSNVNEMAKIIGLEVSSYMGYNDMNIVKEIATVYENYNSFVELDFAKSINSKIYEGLSVNLFKWNGKIYLQRINEAMRENSIFSVNSVQAVKIVKDTLRYDISEGLSEFLDGDLRTKSVLLNDRVQLLDNIQKVEEQLQKIETAMENPVLAKSVELKEAETMLRRELKVLRNKWTSLNEEIDRLQNVDYGSELSLSEDAKFNIGDYVKIKESGETGKIVSIDGTSGRYTVLTDAGRTEDHKVSDIQDLEEALADSAEKNAEKTSDFDNEYFDNDPASDIESDESEEEDGTEEVKESNSAYAKAPSKAKKVKEKQAQPTYSKAPSSKDQDKPMAHDLKNPKAADYAEGVKGQKPTSFDVPGYEIGYNIDEASEADQKAQDLAEAPNFGKVEKMHDKNALSDMAKKHGYAKAPGKNERVSLSYDDNHGYRKLQEGTKKDLDKTNPNFAVAPSSSEQNKVMSHDIKSEKIFNFAVAPSKHRDAIDFGVNDEMGYNLDEAEGQKKK
jgi:hypothetical protein